MSAKKNYKVLRVIAWVMLGFFLLFTGVVLWVRSPWGQELIVGKALDYVAQKTQTKVSIGRLFITFSGNAYLEQLYVEDQMGDTLLYSRDLEVSVAFLPLIFDHTLNLDKVEWSGLKATVSKEDSTEQYNFDFLIQAFASKADSSVVEEEESTPMKFEIGTIRFDDFDLKYNDEVLGIISALQLGSLYLDVDVLDLDSMRFELDELTIRDTRLFYRQTKSTESDSLSDEENEKSSQLPFFSVHELVLDRVDLSYVQPIDSMMAHAAVGHLSLTDPVVNLSDRQIGLERLVLEHSDISYQTRTPRPVVQQDSTERETAVAFQWPTWQVVVKEIDMDDNQLFYQAGDQPVTAGVFNSNAILLKDFQFHVQDINLKEGQARMDLQQLAFREGSGLNLKQLAFGLNVSNQSAHLQGFKLATDLNTLQADVSLQYPSLDQLINAPLSVDAHLSVSQMQLALSEVYLFLPDLAANSTVPAIAKRHVTGVLDIRASQEQIVISESRVDWGETTGVVLNGKVAYPLNSVRLRFDLDQMDVHTRREDVEAILGQQDWGIHIPDTIEMKGKVVGGLDQVQLNTLIHSSDGQIALEGNFSKKDKTVVDATMDVKDLNLGKILQNDKLGLMSFGVQAKGQGKDFETLEGQLTTQFTALQLNKRDYSNLTLSAEVINRVAHLDLSIDDKFIQMSLDADLFLEDHRKELDMMLDLKGIDLYELGFTDQEIRSKMQFRANVVMLDTTAVRWTASIRDGITIYDGESYSFGSFEMSGDMSDDTTNLQLNSRILQAKMVANTNPTQLIAALGRHFESYMQDSLAMDAGYRPVVMRLDLGIEETPLLQDVLLEGLERLDSIMGHVVFDEAQHKLEAKLNVPFTQYQGITIDDVELRVNSDREQMNFSLAWDEVVMEPLLIERTSIDGLIQDQQLVLDFNAYNQEELLVHIKTMIRMEHDTLIYHLDPKGLVINRLPWTIPETNELRVAKNHVDFTDFKLTRNQQSLQLTNKLSRIKQEHLGLVLDNFNVATLTSFLDGGDTLVAGRMGGNLILVNPFGQRGLLADLQIYQLKAMNVPLGVLKLEGSAKGKSNYDFDLSIEGENLEMDLAGEYFAAESGPQMNLDLALRKFEVQTMERFSKGHLTDATGTLTGRAKFRGTTTAPKYHGSFQFKDVAFLVSAIDARFTLPNETIKFNQEQISLNDFTVKDEKNNTFKIDGRVLTKDMTNPGFDLTMTAKNFHALDSKQGDNELFYGKVNLDADLSVKGNLTVPVVRGKLNINEGTNFTIIVPESELDIKERDGVVLFVNKENPDDILTRGGEEELSAKTLKGYDINTVLSINEKSTFKIIINERTNDNLEIAGKGDFNLGLAPNGRTTFTGRYEIGKGHYKASLFNLVTKEFDIAPGSRIVWKGDPLDAELDVRAIYKITTSAAPLMSLKTSGQGTEVTNLYNRRLPFLVYLNVKEELLKPAISFELDMPKDEQSTFGGEVYGQIKQLNEQEEELNKQVFSLLVLDRFFPASGSDGSSGGSAAIARENVSQVLSSQLNSVSDKVVGDSGFELDFNVDSYTDYQGGDSQSRTQLDINAKKKLLDDRMIVQVGSDVNIQGSDPNQQGAPLIGNASVEYLLTEDGRYRVKGFSKDEFDTVIDGQYMVTGVAFSFNREFNKFRELWEKSAAEEKRKEEEAKKKEAQDDQESEDTKTSKKESKKKEKH
ncbi:translocation/assembly module TamB [Reichenbachiella agarivorans]|uniref:Translocation/assembly module TamB n=1 Tax=Reichenbachiella agarivorans TaxID=2979464 RepID=A0ABY6CQF4_9BACT|nr:translocation/assembly module TamB [Reichenbachiella agarivorans]UXP32750.1 translocation/assembly module TamB [Reichenbachiella agarivorans]